MAGNCVGFAGKLAYVQDFGQSIGSGRWRRQGDGDRRSSAVCSVVHYFGDYHGNRRAESPDCILGYMTMKVAAYLQPFTHKLCNMFFHETDPVPEPLPEDETVTEPASLE